MALEQPVTDDRTRRQMRIMSPMIRKAIQAAVEASVKDVETEAKKMIMHGAKTGTVVQLRNPNRTHQRSRKGEAPATDTGTLVSSITHDIDSDKMAGSVIARAGYALALELGTKHMKPRPFLFPALVSLRATIKKRFRKAAVAGARKASKR